jgi:uncharacterized protein YdhG (YjbR/CyaY superfamily)
MSKQAKPKSVTEYIDAAPKETRKPLREMRACLRKTAPGAEESLKWGMPAFSLDRILFTYAGFKHHIGFYPTPGAIKAFAKDLTKFKTSRGGIQFPLEKPLPLPIIRKIAVYRIREVKEKDAKWM